MTVRVGAVLRRVQYHLDELEQGDDQRSERDRAEREGRGAYEGRERGVLRLADAMLSLSLPQRARAILTMRPASRGPK